MNTQTSKYNNLAVALHWLIAALMIYMLFLGEDLIRAPRGQPLDSQGASLHATIGISILLLTLIRLSWRFMHQSPALPATMRSWEVAASHVSHWAFYVLLLAMPLTGWLALTPEVAERGGAESLKLFGLIPAVLMPDLGNAFGSLHEVGGKIGIALLLIHVAAAVKHQFWDRDHIFARMWFDAKKS